jgi:hypothetical protein
MPFLLESPLVAVFPTATVNRLATSNTITLETHANLLPARKIYLKKGGLFGVRSFSFPGRRAGLSAWASLATEQLALSTISFVGLPGNIAETGAQPFKEYWPVVGL